MRTSSPYRRQSSLGSTIRRAARDGSTMRFAALFALFTIVQAKKFIELGPVDNVRERFYILEDELWKNVTNPEWREAGLGGDVELTKEFVKVADQINALPHLRRPALSSWVWRKSSEKIQIIDGLYKSFEEFIRRQAEPGAVPAPMKEWLDLAENVLMDPKVSVAQAITKLQELFEHGGIGLYRAFLQEEDSDVCHLQMSPHQLVYDIYNTIALTEIKGYAMMQFSWMLLRIYGKGNYTQEASLTRQRYGERTSQAASVARAAMSMAKRDLYMCDPSVQREGVTYAQVTRLLQGYITNEVDLNPDQTCRENCGYYTLAKEQGCFNDQFCAKQTTCKGRILDCNYFDSDMWVCPASRTSNRRYEWIEYENGRTLGKPGTCSLGTTKVDSWWRWLFWHCSYCMCLCDDKTNSDRYFSLWDATSDVKNNKVVTGVRLVKHGRVFHLQVHEGTLGERGSVRAGNWVPVQKFDPSESGLRDGVDYHTLTYERRAIDLDELDSPSGHVLTGVRFRLIGAHLHFEIRSTPFNYTTGRLFPDKSQWISNDNTDGSEHPRKRLLLDKPDIPIRSHTPLPVDSEHDQYVDFTHSDFDADAAQSTVPFIDIQAVLPNSGSSLASGAGIIHRGARSSGGFIAVKLITYDFSKHVHAEPPPSDFNEENETTEFMPVIN